MGVNLDEAALPIAAAQDRDERFRALVRGERNAMVAIAYHLVGGDREAAKDVAQEGFLRAYRALPRFREESSMKTWLTRIVINEAARYRRRQAVRARLERIRNYFLPGFSAPENPGITGRDHTGSRPPDTAIKERIVSALGKLSEGQRRSFALVHLEGMTVERAAEVLGRSPGTVKSHLHRALVALRKDLANMYPAGDPGTKGQ